MNFNLKFIIVFILSILMTTSCGLKQLVVPNVDMAIEHKLRKDMALNYTQQKLLANDIDIMLNKLTSPSKKHLYPLLKNFNINKIDKLNKNTYSKQVNLMYIKAANELAIINSKYLSILNQKQLDHHFKAFSKESSKVLKRTKKYNTDLIIQRFEFFIGNLQQKQIDLINSYKGHFIKRNKRRLEQRNRLLSKLTKISNEFKTSKIKQNESLKAYRVYNKETLEFFSNEEGLKTYDLAFNVIKLCNKKQKIRLNSKIKTASDWIQYFSNYEF